MQNLRVSCLVRQRETRQATRARVGMLALEFRVLRGNACVLRLEQLNTLHKVLPGFRSPNTS